MEARSRRSLLYSLYFYTTYLLYIWKEVFYSVSEKLEEVFIVFEDANTYECVILAPDGAEILEMVSVKNTFIQGRGRW